MRLFKINNLQKYLHESAGLERDYIGEILDSRKNAWRVAYGALLLATAAVAAVLMLTPLKSVEPFLLRVDNATGAVDRITTMMPENIEQQEAMDNYWLNQYVINRETYDPKTIQLLYDTTALLSDEDVKREYYALFEGNNARDKMLGNDRVRVTVRSITPDVKAGLATVRFSTQLQNATGMNVEAAKHWIATLSYTYVNASMLEKDRLINPLGFQVTHYRVDPEFAPQGEGL